MGQQAELGLGARLPIHGARGEDILVCGKHFTTDPSGALYWAAQKTLIVADLHLEKGSAAAENGRLLPPYDTRSTLIRLAAAMDRYDPDRVIALGDSFHDEDAADRLPYLDRERLRILAQGREWYWLTGNHDPVLPDWLEGVTCPVLTIDGIRFRHEPSGGPESHEIAGHLHPAARLTRRGASVRRKCYVSNGARLVVPAFGAYAGGLNVLSEAFAPLFGRDFHVWMLGRKEVYPVSKRQLLRD
jgi:hypothetical protein